MATKKTAVLIILDGWGIGRSEDSNPIFAAKPKTFEWLEANYPVTSLQASGISVGLPWSETGNSEVGHLTLGAGKVLYQYYPKIMMAIRDGSFFENQALKDACAHARQNNSAINFAGILTKANVHASIDHLLALIKMAKDENVSQINLHLFADGKDSPPHSLMDMLREIPQEYLASLVGRYYAMDRNNNWNLTETAYLTMIGKLGRIAPDPQAALGSAAAKGLTEEFLAPVRFAEGRNVKDGDSLVFFNFREDSMRQLASAFIVPGFDKFSVTPINELFIATMTHYEDAFTVPVVCPPDSVTETFGKVISDRGGAQIRIAETYKYAHVTYFFNGYHEEAYPGEYRAFVPSNTNAHPEEHPEMMASAVTDRLIESIQSKAFDFILVNYANPDTVAHTANYDAAVEAVRIMDHEIGRVLTISQNPETLLAITSDHGNIEVMIDPITGLPQSQHDASPVPLYLVGEGLKGRRFVNADSRATETLGSLADVAPTILALMGIPKPDEMTGSSLLSALL